MKHKSFSILLKYTVLVLFAFAVSFFAARLFPTRTIHVAVSPRLRVETSSAVLTGTLECHGRDPAAAADAMTRDSETVVHDLKSAGIEARDFRWQEATLSKAGNETVVRRNFECTVTNSGNVPEWQLAELTRGLYLECRLRYTFSDIETHKEKLTEMAFTEAAERAAPIARKLNRRLADAYIIELGNVEIEEIGAQETPVRTLRQAAHIGFKLK